MLSIADLLANLESDESSFIENKIKGYINDHGLKMGEIMPMIRIGVSGTMQGPDLMQTISIVGSKVAGQRLSAAIPVFESTI